MKKKLLCCMVLTVILGISSVPALVSATALIGGGAGGGIVTPMWLNCSTVSPRLSFSGTTAYCAVDINGYSGTTKITTTMTLYLKSGSSWSYVKSWTETVNSKSYLTEQTTTVQSGATYRLEITTTLVRDGVSETITVYSSESTCK